MPNDLQEVGKPSFNPTVLSCVAVSVCAFTAAIIGLAFDHFPSAGMASVGLFYLIIALFNIGVKTPVFDEKSDQSISTVDRCPRVSDASNLTGETAVPLAMNEDGSKLMGAQ